MSPNQGLPCNCGSAHHKSAHTGANWGTLQHSGAQTSRFRGALAPILHRHSVLQQFLRWYQSKARQCKLWVWDDATQSKLHASGCEYCVDELSPSIAVNRAQAGQSWWIIPHLHCWSPTANWFEPLRRQINGVGREITEIKTRIALTQDKSGTCPLRLEGWLTSQKHLDGRRYRRSKLKV